ncbi:MAG: hypothetical protein A2977_02145 [Alphaproteobacteria bacterium RIFCSPLOWO2_01_FULL_45_8]|nr:MAG: hypothetical protein A3K20_03015 [Alphaproteobacteria bacterium GWA1_45_9]OFW90265.1 MAG: hypothetical protein A2621_04725 [Alphaproteobacteria bacterium RIFCSPHIGHO2_01_FULL_41_14]OFW95698.1 MAG: hypothetical protein A2977_02145 [Alphaproteobacteria bacterium RIFCSPLOWO2_01_FULL_45_8]HCI48273.1 hypothetical protein [Holosporales bacterium]
MPISPTLKVIVSAPPPQQGRGLTLTLFTGHTQGFPYVGLLKDKNMVALGLVGPDFPEEAVRADLCHRPAWRQASFQEALVNPQDIEAFELWGTPFQIKVWQALYALPRHQPTTYKEIAYQAGYPRAFQAVGQAISRNPISIFIPCHLVIKKSGERGDYYWGKSLKEKLLNTPQTIFYSN